MADWILNINSLTSVAAAVISSAALLVSIRSSNTARQSLRISRSQEERRLRKLAGNLNDALFDPGGENIYYAFFITVRNPADTPNAISAFELWINYHAGSNRLVLKMPQQVAFTNGFESFTPDMELNTPSRIGPGDTIRGWVGFKVPRDLIQPSSIDSYHLTILDTHEIESSISFAQVRKFKFDAREDNETAQT